MWWKTKFILIVCCLTLMCLPLLSPANSIKAAENSNTEGFIIEADKVVGTGMKASIVKQETSTSNSKLMLRIQYESATIYGMKLTKPVSTGKGTVSITLSANGPVTVYGMTVDTTAISFKGACLKAGETIPELGMENVVMVAHYMKSENSIIEQLVLNTVNGNAQPNKPGQLQILQDLAVLPLSQLDKEIEKMTSGQLPLACSDGSIQEEASRGTGIEQLPDGIGVVTDPLEPVLDPLEPILDPVTKPLEPILDPVTKPLEPILDPVTKPLEPILEPITKPLEPIVDQVTKPLEPIVSGTVGAADQVVQTVCTKVRDANGVINKQLALELMDEAISKKIPLNQVCQENKSVLQMVGNLEDSLLKSLGMVDLFGKILGDPIDVLYKMRDKVLKKPDGAIIYSP
ncbi:hypothetical protein [Neobacillus muris]|uniref:hypothetical protein n=1 Tax=Neobacillus muris TaxID=2941334 RepID=UPI00203FE663|nr:hypothetical protein [Neobacillus muris]